MLGQRRFDDLGTPLFDVPFVVLDLETTGATAASCEITEIGAVKYQAGELNGTFQTLVNPGAPIPPTITVLTGITQAMVVDAPAIGEALPSLLEFIGGAVIVGHNIRFDMSFLNAAAQRLGYGKLPNRSVDTVGLARRLVRQEVRNLRLGTLAAHFRSPTKPTHRALEDAKATAHVFFELLERAGAIGVMYLEDLLRLPTARGQPHYDKLTLTDRLPRRPGVYLFHDHDDTVIYIGKAKNLRSRVRSYFYGDTRKSVSTMLRNMARISHRVCTTELEAEITELRMIHESAPRYNRRSRPPKSTHWLKLTNERYPRLSIVRRYRDDEGTYLGPYRSKRHATSVMAAIWDAVPIRRCNTSGAGVRSAACSFAQLGVALCPCDGTVPDAEYQAVVDILRDGIVAAPERLLEPLAERMRERARHQRFEDAATARDRYRTLATSLERRHHWHALQTAGRLWAEDSGGAGALIDHGRLVTAWRGASRPPLLSLYGQATAPTQTPQSVAAQEEAQLIWRWLTQPGVRVVDSQAPLASPARPVPPLEALAG